MHITLESDYAIRLVRTLAETETRMDARSLSERSDVTLRFALKILGKLVSAGVVRSFKGTMGGYELAKAASVITLYDVIAAVEGPYRFSRCLADDYECPRNGDEGLCKVHKIFGEITEEVVRRLSNVTIASLQK